MRVIASEDSARTLLHDNNSNNHSLFNSEVRMKGMTFVPQSSLTYSSISSIGV